MLHTFNDPIHGSIVLSDLAWSIINTQEFKRLKKLKQIGVAHELYPSMEHSRYVHCIGVYHLTGKYLDKLLKNSPHVSLHPRIYELITIAGLVHDIGHGPFSHIFDNYLLDELKLPHHEERGQEIFKQVVKKYNLPINPHEVDFIISLMVGTSAVPFNLTPGGITPSNPLPHLAGVEGGAAPLWWWQIVANMAFEFDTDKLDYLLRDSLYARYPIAIQVDRIFDHCRIDDAQENIIFNIKVFEDIHEVFMSRYKLHRYVYRHKTVVAFELLIVEFLRSAFAIPRIRERLNDLGDEVLHIMDWIEPKNEEEVKLLNECKRIKLLIDEHKIPQFVKISSEEDSKFKCVKINIGMCSKKYNPLDKILFYDKDGVKKYTTEEISKVLISNYNNENLIYMYKVD